jgi:hypothetical protein
MNTSFIDCAPEGIGMSRKKSSHANGSFFTATLLGICLAVLPGIAATAPAEAGAAGEEPRMSITRHHVAGGRENPSNVKETTEDYEPLLKGSDRSSSSTRGEMSKPGGDTTSQAGSYDFWFYDVDVILFNDDDRDGYYHGIDLLFDADTYFSSAEVYAVLYLSYEGGPWNEYGVTEDFWIYGTSANDEYVMVTELMQGYPTGDYDILIELFDAWDGSFVASYGPEDTSELSYLPLEDYNRDAPVEETRVVVNSGGGGAMDGWLLSAFLLVLLAGAIRKIWRRRNDTLMRIDSPAPIWRSSLPCDHR